MSPAASGDPAAPGNGAVRDALVVYVNGVRHAVRGADAAVTLSDYLRQGRRGCDAHGRPQPDGERLVGTKIACAEGDCGACSVLVGRPDAAGDRLVYETIDACIAFLYQLDRSHIVTVEGLADGDCLSAPQQAMVDCHGSQCGYCTPGFVAALHGLVEQRLEQAGADAAEPLTDDELRLGLSGNLCRCTGYEQILEAGRSLTPAAVGSVASRYDDAAILADFVALGDGPVHVNAPPPTQANGHASNGHLPGNAVSVAAEVYLPKTLPQLLAHRAARPEAKLVSGATDVGVQFNHGRIDPTSVLTTATVRELHRLEIEGDELVIGAATTWSRIEEFVRTRVPEYHHVLTRFGSPQVRHAGSLGGNLANASPIADSIPFHYVAETTLELASVGGVRRVPIADFYLGYKQLDLREDEVIATIRTPLPTDGAMLKLYKISKRRDMDISTATAAFWIELDGDTITTARVAAGGVGPTVVRLPQAEAALAGAAWTEETMRQAGRVARDEVTPITDVRGSAGYRLQLVENLFAKCWHDLAEPAAV